MKFAAAVLLALLPSCTMVGDATEGTIEAAGVAATSVVASPMIGILSWPAWHYLAARSATALTGTAVPDRESVGGGLNIPDPTIGGDRMFWIFIAAGVFILFNTAFGLRLRSNLQGRFRDDAKWEKEVYTPDIASLRAELADLRKRIEVLEAKSS